ncbi:Protein of unknown function [Gryllus bimaculatus]|nr:Protein of unknown function [Gryllus bimaculatus]
MRTRMQVLRMKSLLLKVKLIYNHVHQAKSHSKKIMTLKVNRMKKGHLLSETKRKVANTQKKLAEDEIQHKKEMHELEKKNKMEMHQLEKKKKMEMHELEKEYLSIRILQVKRELQKVQEKKKCLVIKISLCDCGFNVFLPFKK